MSRLLDRDLKSSEEKFPVCTPTTCIIYMAPKNITLTLVNFQFA